MRNAQLRARGGEAQTADLLVTNSTVGVPSPMSKSGALGGFDYNRRMPAGSEAAAVSIWRALFPRITYAMDRINGPYVEVVEERSSLRLDDRYLGPWRGGGLHRTALAAAGDSLLFLKAHLASVTEGSADLPMSALYPVLRTAIESASLSTYLLEPADRDERLRRSYLVAMEDARYADKFTKDVPKAGGSKQRDKTEEAIRVLVATRPSLGDPSKFALPRIAYSDLVLGADAATAADPAATDSVEIPLIAWWKLLSGLSHGKQWAFIAALERSEASVDVTNESATVKLTSSAAAVAVSLQRAVELVELALRLYGRRSKAAWNRPEDAIEPPPVPFARL